MFTFRTLGCYMLLREPQSPNYLCTYWRLYVHVTCTYISRVVSYISQAGPNTSWRHQCSESESQDLAASSS